MPRQRLATARSSFRPEVQGLRFLAVFLVILYHLWGSGVVSGGVDVLFFVSSFFLTRSFVKAFYDGNSINILSQILKTFKRLLPTAVATIGAIFVVSYFILPKNYGKWLTEQGWASLLYWQNWLLLQNSVDYYSPDHSTASPFQHFWSLSVQGQVFVLWPVLLGICAYLCKKFGMSYRTLLFFLFAGIFIVSLWFSIKSASNSPAAAYFDTRTRLWEFSFGSLVAVASPFIHLPEKSKAPLAWGSVAALLAYGLSSGMTSAFPGSAVLWPLTAAAVFMISEPTKPDGSIQRFFGNKRMVFLGNLSYGFYLWHWPILVLYLNYVGKNTSISVKKDSINIIEALGILVLTFLLALVSHYYVEKPTQRFSLTGSIPLTSATRAKIVSQQSAVLVICLALLLGALPFKIWDAPYKERQTESINLAQTGLGNYPYLGAKIFSKDPGASPKDSQNNVFALPQSDDSPTNDKPQLNVASESFLPFPENFDNQWTLLPESCQKLFTPEESDVKQKVLKDNCSALMTAERAASADKLIIAIGDSHIQQWLEPLIPLAEKNNWQIVFLAKGGCSYTDYDVLIQDLYRFNMTPEIQKALEHGIECGNYYDIAELYLKQLTPDLIYTMGTKALPDAPGEELTTGFAQAAQNWRERSIPVMGMRDNPRFSFNMGECALSRSDPNECAVPRDFRVPDTSPLERLGPNSNIIPIDLTDFLCDDNYCYAAAGNVFIYLDDNHLTKDYALSMAPFFEKRFLEATGWS